MRSAYTYDRTAMMKVAYAARTVYTMSDASVPFGGGLTSGAIGWNVFLLFFGFCSHTVTVSIIQHAAFSLVVFT